MWTEFNLNSYVKVKLTDHGRRLLHKNHTALFAQVGASYPYTAPHEDTDGWSTWQLWALMQELGEACVMGSQLPFETTIQIHHSNASGKLSQQGETK